MMRPILPTILLFAALFGPVASTEAQTYEKLYSFTGTPDGAAPIASLIQATGGLFYGTTRDGGANSCGTVFTTDGTSAATILHSFTDAEGCHPAAALLQANDGLFYGMAGDGGAYGGGTLFRMNSIGDVTVLHDFGDPLVDHDGTHPYYGLIQAADGYFYGTTVNGGAFGWGSVFRTRGTAEYEVLHSFGASTFELGPPFGDAFSPGYVPQRVGADPSSPLLQASDGTFFGTTAFGGNPNGDDTPADDPYFRVPGGTVFQLTPPAGTNSQWNVTYRFNFMVGGGNGDTPFGGLIQTSPTTFSGTNSSFAGWYATEGNAEVAGTIFQLDTSPDLFGLYTLYQFGGPPNFLDGVFPYGALMQAGDGNLYGTASLAGPLGKGVVFRMDAAGQVTVLHAFDGNGADGDAGSQPNATLIQGVDGNIYGTTAGTSPFGGGSLPGTVFRLNVDLSAVVKKNQTITFGALAGKTIGDADFVVSATSSSSLKVTFAPSGACTMSGAVVHLTGAQLHHHRLSSRRRVLQSGAKRASVVHGCEAHSHSRAQQSDPTVRRQPEIGDRDHESSRAERSVHHLQRIDDRPDRLRQLRGRGVVDERHVSGDERHGDARHLESSGDVDSVTGQRDRRHDLDRDSDAGLTRTECRRRGQPGEQCAGSRHRAGNGVDHER